MDNTITYKKIIIIACIVSILLGVFLHFAYDLSGNNIIVSLFVPVNESVWEHLKLIAVPFTIFSIAFYFYTHKRFSNVFLLTLLGNTVGMFLITLLYYFGTKIFNSENMIYNIIIYILGVISSYFVFYLGIYNTEFLEETKDSNWLGICTLALLFALFFIGTFSPIKINLTQDPITKTYGIQKKV